MFEVIAGIPPGEYVRRRRLSLAALGLSSGGGKVIDLAFRAGYDSPDAFTKAFKREFGITPSDARQPGVRLKLWPRFTFSVVLKGDTPMNFRIEDCQSLRMTGLPLRVKTTGGANLREIPAFWGQAMQNGSFDRLCKAAPAQSKLGVMGVCVGDFDDQTEELTYLIALETTKDRSLLPAGTVDITAEAGTWAIFEARGPLPCSIQEVSKRIWAEWFPTSGWEHRGGPELEVYSEGDTNAADYYSEVWIPVRKAGK